SPRRGAGRAYQLPRAARCGSVAGRPDCVADLEISIVEVALQQGKGCQDRQENETGDQRIFDGGRPGIVGQEASDKRRHRAILLLGGSRCATKVNKAWSTGPHL